MFCLGLVCCRVAVEQPGNKLVCRLTAIALSPCNTCHPAVLFLVCLSGGVLDYAFVEQNFRGTGRPQGNVQKPFGLESLVNCGYFPDP